MCGCWYCGSTEGDMVFCCEFDTPLHLSCLENEINIQKQNGEDNRELDIIRREFGY